MNHSEKKNRTERRKAIHAVVKSQRNTRPLLEEISRIVRSTHETSNEKIAKITQLLDDYESLQTDTDRLKMTEYEQLLEFDANNHHYYDALQQRSVSLQRKVASVLKVLRFNEQTSHAPVLEAILHYQRTDGHVGYAPPCHFLRTDEQAIVGKGDGFRTSLYKMLLFRDTERAIRAGKLNLQWSYRYRAIQDYLIAQSRWDVDRERLLELAGLSKFADGPTVLAKLKHRLDDKYRGVNEQYLAGENEHLSLDVLGKLRVSTPATEYRDDQYVSSLLKEPCGLVPILQVMRDINHITEFSRCFKHLNPKHSKLKPTADTIIAGVMGNGCNIGIDTLAHISKGINDNTLKNTVHWCFGLKNIQKANNQVIGLIDELALPNAFRRFPNEMHTSSDGRKVNVAVASLLATYSPKHFGKDKGVTIYTFIDERHCLFHSTVISASDREAAWVIDGLMQNDVVKSDIHSTDTHGFTEAIFAATHMIDTAFAPRFKDLGKQALYGFSDKSTYKRRGYAIAPGNRIKQKLILDNWDDVPRFMATIKLRYVTASQLFKRLSSYSSDHPLYKALKEFGRIIKSQFILTFADDVALRQRIQKQLNKGELANSFSKAVCFASNQEFQEGTKEEQDTVAACTVLIQNSIVLWNYLALSQQLSNTADKREREAMLSSIISGSITCWGHINMQGEYDFRQEAANDQQFDLEKILTFKLA